MGVHLTKAFTLQGYFFANMGIRITEMFFA